MRSVQLNDLVRPSEVPRQAWRALVARSRPSNPKLLPEIALDAADGREEPLLYWRGEGGQASSIAVMERRRVRLARAPGVGRLTTLRALRVIGNDVYGDVDGVDAERFIEAACAVLDSGRADCVLFDDLSTDSPLAEPIAAAERERRVAVFRPGPPQPHWYVQFPSPASDYWKSLSRNARNQLRRKARNLGHRLVRISDKRDVAEFLEKARYISERSWQGKRLGLRVRASPREIRETETLAEAGALRSYLLESDDGVPLAFVIGSQWHGRFLYDETGYDIAYSDRSPGVVLVFRMIEDLIAEDTPELLDFGAGDAQYKRRFSNLCTESGRVVLVRRSGRPLAAHHIARAYLASDRHARALMRRAGIYERARKLYRGRR